LKLLLHSDTRYNTLTDKQIELLSLYHSGMSEDEIAKNLGMSVSKVKRQRFLLQEKAKQAKLYLAIYECAFNN